MKICFIDDKMYLLKRLFFFFFLLSLHFFYLLTDHRLMYRLFLNSMSLLLIAKGNIFFHLAINFSIFICFFSLLYFIKKLFNQFLQINISSVYLYSLLIDDLTSGWYCLIIPFQSERFCKINLIEETRFPFFFLRS